MKWKLRYNITIRLVTPACRINDDRQISAESWNNFHIVHHLNSKTTGPILPTFYTM